MWFEVKQQVYSANVMDMHEAKPGKMDMIKEAEVLYKL